MTTWAESCNGSEHPHAPLLCPHEGKVPVPQIAHTAEFQRIAALPRRVLTEGELAYLAAELTSILRTPSGTMTLKPIQALALHDAGVEGGLFGPLGVGEGKTLTSMLLPAVIPCQRPLLLLPAGLIENAQRARRELSRHWRIPTSLRIFSYNMLGLADHEHELETYAPDLIVNDEGHRAKNKGAAVTRRIARYMMHGLLFTAFARKLLAPFMDKSLKEFAHILRWCLKTKSPIPITTEEIEEWAEALDQNVDPMCRRAPGALLELCTAAERASNPPHVAARLGFRRRLTETPGVVATVGAGETVGCSIYVREIRHKVSPLVEEHFAKLRGDGTPEHPGWETPDGWQLMTGAEVYAIAQELALGLHYVWDPRPPPEWSEARRGWNAFARDVISRGRTYDSPLHVANACDAGKLDGAALERWRKLEPTFKPNVVPVWHDDHAIDTCTAWLKKPGIVWTEHRFFAERLSKLSGVPYYGAQGLDAVGVYIEDAKPGSSAIASIDANREGKNLQKLWHRNMLVCPPRSAAWLEQTIARTHRPGQLADEVTVDVLIGCRENFDNIVGAIEDAQAIQQMTGKIQKLTLADVTLPSVGEMDRLLTPRWQRK